MKNRWLRCVLIVMIAAIWAAMPHSALAEETCTMYVHTQRDMLNARRDRSVDSPIEMLLMCGDTVEVIRVENNWAEIVGGEAGTAWCCADYLASYPPGEDAPVYTVVSDGRVRVREAIAADFFGLNPNADETVLRYLHNGDTVEVQFIIGGWAYIGNGYVMAEYLKEKSEK